MRRSICFCEPSHTRAGEINTWKFIYTPATSLPKGTKISFDLMSKGRDIDWEIPSANLKKTSNVIYAQVNDSKPLQAKEIEVADNICPHFEFVLPTALEAGNNFTIYVGSPKGVEDKENGTRAQTQSQRRRTFALQVDPTGKGNYGEPELFTMDIRGNTLKTIKILTPSFVSRNKRFDVVVRFEDQYGNLTSYAPDETLIELSHEYLRENLNWKIFVPETGFITLPNLYFNEPGVYTIRLRNTHTKEIFQSSPIKCFADNNEHLFWGVLHGESERIDSTENIESCLRHIRDEKAFNFFACSPFESSEETSNDVWKTIVQSILEFDEADRFNTFVGFQWQGEPGEEGARQIIYAKDQKQILRKKESKNSTLQKIYKSFSPKEIISIPTFTMGKGVEYNFENFDPEFERVVEIYNAWGSSECSKKDGNPLPISTKGKKGMQEAAEGSIQKALNKNLRFGFVGGGLDDRGFYSSFYEGDQVQYTPGLTAIICEEQTRSALFDAIYRRACYATTGEKIIVGLQLAGVPMGGEVSTAQKHGLLINRHLAGYVAGTKKIKLVEIIRNGKVIHTYEPEGYNFDFAYDDLVPLDQVTINAKDKKPPFVYYYIRVTQEDGHMAWSSPIWVDFVPSAPKKPTTAKPIPKVAPKKIEIPEEEDEFDVDEDEDDDYLD
ncbi:MAG: DUF3604 domain-containing protein [Chlamydia sp. 32-24]|nr:MAG: DUF3604 domain-containing protein [Chlamydia sp. 32-24]